MIANYGRRFQISHGDEGDRTPDLRNAIAALSQLSYVPEVQVAESHTGGSTRAAKPTRGPMTSQGNRTGGKDEGRYFAAPSDVPKEPAGRREKARVCVLTSEVMLRRVTAQ
jgi:hypothetical protein